ncbi:hypothetical protein BDZ90DRAFT_212789, partial [Jaminaea rosea]
PLDEAEQRAIITSLRTSHDKSAKIYRYATLFLLSLVIITYLTPIPAYIAGTHPENHLTLFWAAHHVQGTHEDLIYLPAGPIYMLFFAFQGIIVVGAIRETVDLLGLAKLGPKPAAFPAPQPHLYGTAPGWLVPSLQDLRFSSATNQSVNSKTPATSPAAAQRPGLASVAPRLVYLGVLLVTSLPMPLMVFGAGNFTNAAWWALAPGALLIDLLVEWSIAGSEREIRGLDGQRYSYKGA